MKHSSIQNIQDEHASLSAMLLSLRMMVKRGPKDESTLFFDVLRAMLFNIDEVPEKQHHTKESQFLFPAIARRSLTCKALIESLEVEHQKGESAVRELQHMLLAWEILGDSRRKEFEEAVTRYLDFYFLHMKQEETIIIPEALKVLTTDDWLLIDQAFAYNKDPLSKNNQRDPIYDRLFTKIVMQAPEPIGLGARH